MRRIAIDFSTTGIRRAILDNGDVTVGESHEIDAFAQLEQWLRDADGDVTLRCTHPQFREKPRGYWNDMAATVGCRWLRVLGDHAEESVALGVARQLAMQTRTMPFAVIDAGESQSAIAIVRGHGQIPATKQWCHDGELDARDDTIVAEIEQYLNASVDTSGSDSISLVGIGGHGPAITRRIAGALPNVTLIELRNPIELLTVGILLANIVLSFEFPLSSKADARQIADSLSALMDEAFEAITREGYDLDDAECIREVIMTRGDGTGERAVAVGMNIDLEELRRDYGDLESVAVDDLGSINVATARVTAIIEPTKPIVDLFHGLHRGNG